MRHTPEVERTEIARTFDMLRKQVERMAEKERENAVEFPAFASEAMNAAVTCDVITRLIETAKETALGWINDETP